MLIPHLHFCDDCEEAISLYEKAFGTKDVAVHLIIMFKKHRRFACLL